MRAIKGNIGASKRFATDMVFLPHRHEAKEDARSSRSGRRISPFSRLAFT
jgi:hypothetical protein